MASSDCIASRVEQDTLHVMLHAVVFVRNPNIFHSIESLKMPKLQIVASSFGNCLSLDLVSGWEFQNLLWYQDTLSNKCIFLNFNEFLLTRKHFAAGKMHSRETLQRVPRPEIFLKCKDDYSTYYLSTFWLAQCPCPTSWQLILWQLWIVTLQCLGKKKKNPRKKGWSSKYL